MHRLLLAPPQLFRLPPHHQLPLLRQKSLLLLLESLLLLLLLLHLLLPLMLLALLHHLAPQRLHLLPFIRPFLPHTPQFFLLASRRLINRLCRSFLNDGVKLTL